MVVTVGIVAPMSTSAAGRSFGGLIDRRLAQRVAVTRRYLAVAVLVGLAGTACVVVQAVLLATVVNRVVRHGAGPGQVAPELVGLAAAFLGRAICGWVAELAAQRTSATVTSTLRRQLIARAVDLGPTWLAGERTGELSLAATRGVAALEVYFGRYLPTAVQAAVAPLALVAWVGWEDWPSLLILAALMAAVPVAMVHFGRRADAETRRQWRGLSTLSARFLEVLRGLPTLRAFGQAGATRREVAAATEALRQTTMQNLRVAFLSGLVMEFVAGIGVGLVAMVLGLRLLAGQLSLFTALAVLLVSPEVFLPLRRAGAEFHASTEGQAAAQRILELLEAPAPAPAEGTPGPAAPATPDPATGRLQLAGVRVTYPERGRPALDGFDLGLEPGQHVALVGPSGAGKSTVLAVLLGFVRPQAGSVSVGGVDLAGVDPAQWRRRLTWVPQHPRLISGTLGQNVVLGDPDAGEARLRWALETAGLARLVDGLAEGLATPIGEGGLTLSMGERQRVALARALVRDAPLVLFDEPVAHLDAATEEELADRLAPWLEHRSVLVAAHRPELVRRIDAVVTLGGEGSRPTPAPVGQQVGP